jgi:hypothetical protein
VVVGRGEDLLAGFEWQAVINERKPHGRIARQGNLVRSASDVLSGCLSDLVRKVLGLGTPQATIDDEKGVLIERTPVLLNRLTNRTGMRSKGEGCEVNIFGREIELVASPPTSRPDFPYRHGSRGDERASREQDASIGEKLTTSNRHNASLAIRLRIFRRPLVADRGRSLAVSHSSDLLTSSNRGCTGRKARFFVRPKPTVARLKSKGAIVREALSRKLRAPQITLPKGGGLQIGNLRATHSRCNRRRALHFRDMSTTTERQPTPEALPPCGIQADTRTQRARSAAPAG